MSVSRQTAIWAAIAAGLISAVAGAQTSAAPWTLTSPMPLARWFHAAGAGSDGRVYAYGGYVRTPTRHRGFGIGENGLAIFDPASGLWSMGPAPPEARQRIRVRLVGGRTGATADPVEFRDREGSGPLPHELFAGDQSPAGRPHWFDRGGPAVFFDPATRGWQQEPSPGLLADKPDWTMEDFKKGVAQTRLEGTWPVFWRYFASAATSADGKVYVIGGTGRRSGQEHATDDSELLAAVDVYDAVANRWYAIPPMREARQLHAAAFGRDGRLYVFGGVASQGGPGAQREGESNRAYEKRIDESRTASATSLASVEIYDPKTETWTQGRRMPTPRQAMGAALGADGKIYVVGGTKSYSTPDPLDTVEIYDPATDTWEKGPPLIYPRRAHAVVATPDGKIYAIGGWVWSRKFRLPMSDGPRFMEDGKDLRATAEVLDTKSAP